MIDEKKMQEVKANIPRYLNENLIIKKPIDQNIIDFYRKNAAMSLKVAEILFILSTQEDAKEKLSLEKDFESNLWVQQLGLEWPEVSKTYKYVKFINRASSQ